MKRPRLLVFWLPPAWLLVGWTWAVGDQPAATNVVFIISDDLKASVLGCYGNPVCETPHIDRLAARSMVFDRAYCQGTACAPSRTSLMFSRYFGDRGISMGENFIRHGYHSTRVGKIFHMRVPGDIIAGTDGQDVAACWTERTNMPGLEAHTPGDYACLNLNLFTTDLENRQSTAMPHRMFVTVSYEGDGSDQPDWKTATKSTQLLQRYSQQQQPFFLAIGFIRPHYPSVAPVQYFDRYPHEQIELPFVPEGHLDEIPPAGISRSNSQQSGIDRFPENQQRMWAAYYATVTFLDDQVGRVLDEIDRLGLADTTAIVFTSDHGYHLGEHTFWQKTNLREEVIRVPLMISAPGLTPGRSDSIVELMDIYPTLCALTGIATPPTVQGHNLVPVLRNPTVSVRDAALSILRNGHSLRCPRWAFMRYQDESEELYDMDADPQQFRNLARRDGHDAILQDFRQRLQAILADAPPTAPKNVKPKGKP
jgi:iduronate 2-sulfatase